MIRRSASPAADRVAGCDRAQAHGVRLSMAPAGTISYFDLPNWASVHYWDTDIRHLGQSMNLKRGSMSAVPSMAVAPEPPRDTGSFVPRADSCTAANYVHGLQSFNHLVGAQQNR